MPETTDNAEHTIGKMLNWAGAARDADDQKWSDRACGQDTEEAEASGFLAGQVAGLQAALMVLHGNPEMAKGCLDLVIDP